MLQLLLWNGDWRKRLVSQHDEETYIFGVHTKKEIYDQGKKDWHYWANYISGESDMYIYDLIEQWILINRYKPDSTYN